MTRPSVHSALFIVPILDPACFRDHRFWIALGLGPLAWLLLIFVFKQPIADRTSLSATLLLSIVLLYPVLEELIFRGAIQGWLISKDFANASRWGISMANVLASIVFTALHFLTQAPLWAALVFLPSLVFGWARDRYQSLTAPIVLHAVYNAGFILLFA